MANPFDVAYATVDEVNTIVTDRIRDAVETAALFQREALAAINRLNNINFNFGGSVPSPPAIDPNINIDMKLPAINATSFGTITSQQPSFPALDTVPGISNVVFPDFVPSITGIYIPDPPVWTAPTAPPIRPTLGTVNIPTAPNIVLPNVPALADINIPSFSGINIPNFDFEEPEFEGSALPGQLQWKEPTYHPEIIDEVIEQIRRLWSGGSGIPAAVEQAMFERAAAREDLAVVRTINEIATDFSSRGYTSPPGMMAARIDNMQQDLAVKKLSANRELTIQIAQWQVENVRFAVEQGIAAENVFVNIFFNQAARLFEAARFNVESQLNIYNMQIVLFNAKMTALQIRAQVFETKMRAELAKIEVFKAEVEAEIARGQLNEQKVRIYVAQVQAAQTRIDIYRAQMQGASIESEVIRNMIEAYRADVQAYAERINADKVRFDAYEAQVKGEAAKVGIIDAEARAFAAVISGKATAANVDIKRAELIISKNDATVRGYVAQLDAERARVQSQLSTIQANAQAYIADTQRYAAQAQAETAKANAIITAKEAELRTNVAFYQAQVQAFVANIEQMIRKAQMAIEAAKAAGQIASTMAAGAMAGVNVGATLSGAGSVGASGAYQETQSKSEGTSINHNYTYEGT